MNWETVAIPLAKGLDLRTRERLVAPTDLVIADNVAFPATAGVAKRFGHSERKIVANKAIPANTAISEIGSQQGLVWSEPYAEKSLPSNWLYGYGLFDAADLTGITNQSSTSPHPSAGLLCGAATRDNEQLVWNGFNLLSVPRSAPINSPCGSPELSSSLCNATLAAPAVRTTPIAKTGTSQLMASLADNGVIKVLAWLEGTVVYANVYDSETDSPIRLRVSLATETGLTITSVMVKCVPVNEWVHILVSDSSANKLYRVTVSGAAPGATMTSADLGSCKGQFDTRKINDVSWAAVIQDSSENAVLTYFSASGPALTSPAPQRTVLVNSTHVSALGFDVHPVTERIGLIWHDDNTAEVHCRVFSSAGVAFTADTTLDTAIVATKPGLSIAALYVGSTAALPTLFQCFWEDDNGDINSKLSNGTNSIKRYNMRLFSQAFRAGQTAFIIAAYTSSLQTTYFLLDCALLPVGKMEYGTAYIPANATGWLSPVNFKGTAPAKDRLVFHTAIQYNLRLKGTALDGLSPAAPSTSAVFSETSTKECYLDFLPRLRSAQAGRATYFAGAQLWQYDGRACTEQGFHLGPEPGAAHYSLVASNSTGSLANNGQYRYYIQLAYRNAQGEEIRGPGFLSNQITLGAADNTVTVTIPTLLTRRSDSYFLVYRNENAGTLWYLTSNRDPASSDCPKNTLSTASTTFVDKTSDANLIKNELCPANPAGYLETYSSPACEIVASGKDRLWVAGGECPSGQVFPSRLFYPTQVPSFNLALGILVDRGPDAITGIGFVEDVAVIFRRDHTYVQEGDGIDNGSTGGWPATRLALAEVGALSQEGLALIPHGLCFQSPAGIRLIGPGGELVPLGLDVDPVAKNAHISAALVVPDDQQVRFYSPDDGALVYDYLQDCWSKWTGVECWGAVKSPSLRRALLAKPDGHAWQEDESLYTDAGMTYRMKIRTAWLHGGSIGAFQRVRRVGFYGELPGTLPTLTVRLFYDENHFPEEERVWDTSADLNTATWGALQWGETALVSGSPLGVWGDVSTANGLRERTLRARFRTARQKCGAIAIELDDNSASGPGIIGTAFFLEIGARGGTDRVPWRTSTQTQYVAMTGAKSAPDKNKGGGGGGA